MKKVLLSFVSLVVLSGAASIALADHQHSGGEFKVELNFDDLHIKSRIDDNVIKLKKALRHQKGLFPGDYNIKAAVLVAKSKHGRGKAKLIVGQSDTGLQVVDGVPREFHDYSLETYDIIPFVNETGGSHGKWQVHVFGNFKIKKVVLLLSKKSRRGGRGNRFGVGH